ncbi:MAG: tryptophan synthase subunit alpha [Armatimonadota bacterium]
MKRIIDKFAELASRNEKALICFLTGGDPDFELSEGLVQKVAEAGADIIEIGVPFSDPLADGPSIQASTFRALSNGASVSKVLASVKKIRETCDVPIVLMSYFNPVRAYGVESFAKDAKNAGADGVIMTDLPPEEAYEWKKAADENNLATIFLIAPTSTEERLNLGAKMASGFIYCVSRTGVTGARQDVPTELKDLVDLIKSKTKTPVVIGFGISKPEHVKQVSSFADGAVVGSALVNIVSNNLENREKLIDEAVKYVSALKAATK